MHLLTPGCRAITTEGAAVSILSIDGASVCVRPLNGGRFFSVAADQLTPWQFDAQPVESLPLLAD